ncbi:autoinducer binding domain-containing protein, partial [Janthinobacterium sp. ROICE36]|uniref:autoinducer binding domain-containing protein n=1 Tax=Janthinobacterium sp. ROICE36 TaxID=2048670 RepID=UPI0011AEC994
AKLLRYSLLPRHATETRPWHARRLATRLRWKPDSASPRLNSYNYLTVDPTVSHAMRSTTPLAWSDQLFSASDILWQDARGHGLHAGVAQSAFNARGAVGMLTLARSSDQVSSSEMGNTAIRLSWLLQAVHENAVRLLYPYPAVENEIMLTAREIEVLRWAGDGKTSGEVGQIMSISERTVNFHITNALAKLGAVNKTAGVVKAAMLRLL